MKRILGLACLVFAIPAFAVIPQFWEVRTYDQFRRGELKNLSVTGDGDLVLAPGFDVLFETGDPLIFSGVTDSTGIVYLGTGHDGKVYRVESDGQGRVVADLPELDVLSLAVDAQDTLFVGTSPNGKVYRIGPGGSAESFFEPETRYIWSMVFDAEGRLLVASGDDGVIYRVGTDGQSEVFYDSEETHIVAMTLDPNGNVIAGGDPKGYVYRISDQGQGFVLYDSGMREVHSLVVSDDGTIYAALMNGDGDAIPAAAPGAVSSDSTATPSLTVTVGNNSADGAAAQNVGVQTTSSTDAPRPGTRQSGRGGGAQAQSMILEIAPDGAVTSLWESDSEMVFSLLVREERLLFSTGTRGRVYALDGPRRTTLLVESTEEQTTRLWSDGDRVLATSSNAGKLFELDDARGTSGSYESIVRDTGAISSWGKVTWTGRGVEILTRSGNTGSPDQTWSDWIRIGADGEVFSPNARFVQWRAVFGAGGDEAPMLSSVTMPYLQQNFRPEIRNIDVLRSGISLQLVQTSNNNAAGGNAVVSSGISGRVVSVRPRVTPRTTLRPGAQALRWNARDRNDDVLVYSILYRAQNEGEWKLLVEGMEDSFYTIEPDTLPDGIYAFRIVASDVGSNPPERALDEEMETRPFAIDSTPPAVTVVQQGVENHSVSLHVEATDQTSTLKQAEVSVDAGYWRPVFPVDGIVDSESETFEFSSVELEPGEHVVAFRIYDQNENVGIGKTIVQIP